MLKVPRLTKNQLKDPSGLDPKIKELQKKLLKAIEATRSKSLDMLLSYMQLNEFERTLLLNNFDVLMDSLNKELKKHQTDYFGWALLFAYFHYRQYKNIYWGVAVPEVTPEGETVYKKPPVTMRLPPIPAEVQTMYNERTNTLMDNLRDELHTGVKFDLDMSVASNWDEEKLKKKLDERFRRAENRAKMIAVTELQYAYNQFIITEARKDGFTKLQWITQADEFVCKECAPRHGKIYDIDDLPDILVHPQCRCVYRPYIEK